MNQTYDHYIAVDWAQANMAIARMTGKTHRIVTIDVRADVKELQLYLSRLQGSKILTIEETTTSQWLYSELRSSVDDLIVCDPYRNHLLQEGAKSDRIDAEKLVQLLRANLLKPVFHTGDTFIYLRKFVSGYEDVVKAGVRLKNQRAALFRAVGKNKNETTLEHSAEKFVLKGLDQGIEAYEKEKGRYEEEFGRVTKKYLAVKNLDTLPGLGPINATKIAAIVVDPRRFQDRGHFLSYCGLIKLEKISGGKSYGKKNPRCCRILRGVFKTAAFSIIAKGENKKNPLNNYYHYLIQEKHYSPHTATSALARRIAVLAYGILKTGKKFNPEILKCKNQ